jgi:hypothetical protein
MTPKTIRNLLLVCILLDLVLVGVVLWDYFQNDSDLIVIVLGVFAVFVIITAILFLKASRIPAEERIVTRVVEREGPGHTDLELTKLTQIDHITHVDHVHRPEPLGDVLPPIPPAPARTTTTVNRSSPPRPALQARETHARPVNAVRRIGKRPRRRTLGPFRYRGYILHRKDVKLANGNGTRTIWFFAKKRPKSGKPSRKPRGYHVGVNKRTGLPFLVSGRGKDGEDLTPAKAKPGYRPQCMALTDDGKQCRNSARKGSKYCAPHVGYQPPTTKGLAKRIEGKTWSATDKRTDRSSVKGADTRAAVRRAPDTVVSVRKRRRVPAKGRRAAATARRR